MKRSVMAGVMASVARRPAAGQVPPSDRITVGLLGSGARAHQIMEAAAHLPGVEIVAVCDAYRGRAERARARTGGRAAIHDDYREILARKDVDTVIVSTPDHWHRAMVIESLEAGKDVYVEKPLTYRIEEGQEIVEAVRRTKRIVQVGSQMMSSATDRRAREIIQSGRLGQITLVRASWNRNTAGGAWLYPIPPDASPKTVNWEQFLGPAPRHPFDLERFFRWRCYWDYSGGISTDLFVHLLTTIHYVMDARMPERVIASGERYRWKQTHEVPDTVHAILVYPEGFTVNVSSTFNNQSGSESGFEVLGTEGSVAFRGQTLKFVPEQVYEDNRWVVASWPEELERAYYADPKVQAIESPWTWAPEMKAGEQAWQEWGRDATVEHLADFVDAVRTRRAPAQDAATGHRAAAGAHMINESIRQGKPLEWDFSAERLKATQ